MVDNLTNVRLGGGGAAWAGPTGSSGANLLNIDRGLTAAGWAAGRGPRRRHGGRSIDRPAGRETASVEEHPESTPPGRPIHGTQGGPTSPRPSVPAAGRARAVERLPVAGADPEPDPPRRHPPRRGHGTPRPVVGKSGSPSGGSSKGGSGPKPWRSPADRAAKAASRARSMPPPSGGTWTWPTPGTSRTCVTPTPAVPGVGRDPLSAEPRRAPRRLQRRHGGKAPRAHPREAPAGNPGRTHPGGRGHRVRLADPEPDPKVRDEIYNAWAIRREQRSAGVRPHLRGHAGGREAERWW